MGYNDDFKERILIAAFYLVGTNSMNIQRE
jgi:hypothetical protein